MKKKGSYWFSKLSEREQVEFRENVEKDWGEKVDNFFDYEFSSFYQLIVEAFPWRLSGQFFDYWKGISQRVVE